MQVQQLGEMESMELTKSSDVSFPEMRRNAVSAVHTLADEAYQRRVWLDKDYPEALLKMA
ncbi:hypothetical protein ABZ490_41350 [Streptomyces sp. NPDC005811]|uniref:hypothetical protein n=1 Tax=Streptomyces sp. NPDC005811 TaxID=3154565 RepID=UPI0033D427F2